MFRVKKCFILCHCFLSLLWFLCYWPLLLLCVPCSTAKAMNTTIKDNKFCCLSTVRWIGWRKDQQGHTQKLCFKRLRRHKWKIFSFHSNHSMNLISALQIWHSTEGPPLTRKPLTQKPLTRFPLPRFLAYVHVSGGINVSRGLQ